MLMLLLWSLPTLIHLMLSRGDDGGQSRRLNGLLPVGWWWIGWGVVVGLVCLMAGMIAVAGLPREALAGSTVSGAITGPGAALGVAAAAAGEEIFFRGFLQGHLARWRGERFALWGQAVIFLLPHLPLLLVDARLRVLLPVQFLAGLLLGMLRRSSGSVLPAVTAHALTNMASGILLG